MTNNVINDVKKGMFWQRINTVYAVFLVLVGLVWFIQLHTFGVSVGIAAIAIAVFIYRHQRWAYFAAAVWCFGLLRIAMDDGHDFHQGLQSWVRLPYLIGLIIPIILHEKVAKKAVSSYDGVPPEPQ